MLFVQNTVGVSFEIRNHTRTSITLETNIGNDLTFA